jgi:two-component sensor histidine kinase
MRSQGAKKAAILLSLALAPSCAMAWLGLRSIGVEEREAEQTSLTKAQRAAIQVDTFIQEHINRLKSKFYEELTRRPSTRSLSSSAKRIENLNQRSEEFSFVFALDLDGDLIIPGAAPYDRMYPPSRIELDIVRAARDLAQSSEIETDDPSFARSILLGALADVSNRHLHAQIELELAKLAIRHRLPEIALDHLQTLYLEYPDAREDRTGRLPLALRFWPPFADLLQSLGGAELPPLAPLATLAENLATNRWQVPSAVRNTRWNLVMSDLKDLELSRAEDDPEQAARIKAKVIQLNRLHKSYDVLQSRAAAEIGRRLEEFVSRNKNSDDIDPSPITIEIATSHGTHLYLAAPFIRDEIASIVAVEISLDHVVEVLKNKVSDLTSPYEAQLALLEGARLLAGSDQLTDSEKSGTGLPSLASIKNWKIVSAPLDPGGPAREARKRWFYYGILVFSCLLAALIGSVVTVKSIDRQVMLARMRTQLVRNVSHELRTPVASIRMLGEILQEGGLAREREQDYFDRIAREAQRLGTLVEKVLSLAQIEQGARQIQVVEVQLGQVAEHLVDNFRRSEEGREISIHFDDQSKDTLSLVDPEALDQILINLLSNAVKYGEGKDIDVLVTADHRRVHLSIRDYGRGIAPEAREKLFSPFFRERPEDNSATGIGIGLTIVKQLIVLMKGRIEIDPAITSNGTRFIVSFPAR